MTSFEHQPIKQIIIQQLMRCDQNELVRNIITLGSASHAKWIDGILFIHFTQVDTPDIIRKEMEGIMYWTSLEFAKCPIKPNVVKTDGNGTEIPVFDVSVNPIFIDFAKWLKDQPIWKDAQ